MALAFLALTGNGRSADAQEAGRLFVLAAEQGEPRGLYHAALLHLSGDGLPKDLDKAETYLRKSGPARAAGLAAGEEEGSPRLHRVTCVDLTAR